MIYEIDIDSKFIVKREVIENITKPNSKFSFSTQTIVTRKVFEDIAKLNNVNVDDVALDDIEPILKNINVFLR